MFQFCIFSFAADSYIVSADTTEITTEQAALVPINIYSNKGIMGFRITVTYDPNEINIKSVARGTVTEKGNFNTSFGEKDGTFDIVWNNTEETANDGSLFTISVIAQEGLSEQSQIKITYSQPDTFNEAYNDVQLNCSNIILNPKNIGTQNNTSVSEEPTSANADENNIENTTQITPSSAQVILAIETAMEDSGYTSVQQAKDDETFLEKVRENLSSVSGNDDYDFADAASVESLYNSSYEGNYIMEVMNAVDATDIDEAISSALKTVNAKSISDIKDSKKSKFVEKTDDNIKKYYPDAPSISKDLPTETAISIIEKLYSLNSQKTIQSDKSDSKLSKTIVLTLIIVLIVAAITAIAIVVKRRKTK